MPRKARNNRVRWIYGRLNRLGVTDYRACLEKKHHSLQKYRSFFRLSCYFRVWTASLYCHVFSLPLFLLYKDGGQNRDQVCSWHLFLSSKAYDGGPGCSWHLFLSSIVRWGGVPEHGTGGQVCCIQLFLSTKAYDGGQACSWDLFFSSKA